MSKRFIKNPLLLILSVMAGAVGLVSMLAWVALKPINEKNGFNRKFITTELVKLEVVDNVASTVSIAGATNHHIYFKTKDPGKIWVTDDHLQDGNYITLNVPNNSRIASSFYMEVDSPTVHIMAGNWPAVITSDLTRGTTTVYRFPTRSFSRGIKISPTTYAFRGFDTVKRKTGQIFMKGNPLTGELIRNENITQDAVGGIITDGLLNYDESSNLLTYVSFYNNQFFCLDTNLVLLYIGHTIDTVTKYQIEANQSGNIITNTSPARIINTKCRTVNTKLYIISKLKSDNEKENKFKENAVLDVYDIPSGKYQSSFYIPYYKREKISDYKIMGDKILILYKSHLVLYQLK